MQVQAKIGKAHYPQAKRTRPFHYIVNLRQRPRAGVDNVIQEARAQVRHFAQTVPVQPMFRVKELVHIDRAQIARVREVQKLFATGIARHDRAHRLHHVIVPVHFIDEGDAGLGILVGAGNDPVPDVRRENHPRPRRFFLDAIRQIS